MYNILICDDKQGTVNALQIYFSNPKSILFEAHIGYEALDFCWG